MRHTNHTRPTGAHTHWSPPDGPALQAPGDPGERAERSEPGIVVRRVARIWVDWDRCCQSPWGYMVGLCATGAIVGIALPDHPAHALDRFTAPTAWQAVGVAVRGAVGGAVGGAPRRGTPARGPAAVVWMCHRNGTTATWLALPGDEPMVTVDLHLHATGSGNQGVVAAALRRSLH